MGKYSKEEAKKVTVKLTEEEGKVLIAIASHLKNKEATAKDWKELAKRFGFRDHRQLKRYLYERFPGEEVNESEGKQIDEHPH